MPPFFRILLQFRFHLNFGSIFCGMTSRHIGMCFWHIEYCTPFICHPLSIEVLVPQWLQSHWILFSKLKFWSYSYNFEPQNGDKKVLDHSFGLGLEECYQNLNIGRKELNGTRMHAIMPYCYSKTITKLNQNSNVNSYFKLGCLFILFIMLRSLGLYAPW